MTASSNATSSQLSMNGRPMAGQLVHAMVAALQRSLSSDVEAPAALSPTVLKPLKLLPRHMLLVGEETSRQRPALDVLSRWDIAAEVATNGDEALQIAAAREFDLILFDAKKSVLDGVFVGSHLRHLERAHDERPTAALVARVAGDWPSGEAVLRMVGFNDVLTVDTDEPAVRECLRRWCCGRYLGASGESGASAHPSV